MLMGAGARAREELIALMSEPPPELLQLNRADLEALLALLDKLPVNPAIAGRESDAKPASPEINLASDRTE